jgi:hypothetical protein
VGAFSASDAALEGFQVLRRDWRIVLGWCLFSVLGFVALVVVAAIIIFAATLGAASADQAKAMGGLIGGLTFGLGAVLIEAMVIAALYRRMFWPERPPGFLCLRIGADELRLVGLGLIYAAAATGLLIASYLVFAALRAAGDAAEAAAFVAIAALGLWLWLRSSLAAPAAVAERRFSLARSWRLTRRRLWPIAGAALLAFCLLGLIFVVLWIATFVVQAAIGGFHSFAPVRLSDPQALAERPGAYAFGVLAELVLAPVLWIISAAPFAAIYRAVTEDDA